MTTELYESIGKNIRAIRKSRKQTQEELGKALGLSQSAIMSYETGYRRITLESILKLCSFYEISVNNIVPNDDNSPIGEELTAEMKFLEELKTQHFNAEEQKLILDFANLITKGRSVNIGESYDQRQE